MLRFFAIIMSMLIFTAANARVVDCNMDPDGCEKYRNAPKKSSYIYASALPEDNLRDLAAIADKIGGKAAQVPSSDDYSLGNDSLTKSTNAKKNLGEEEDDSKIDH